MQKIYILQVATINAEWFVAAVLWLQTPSNRINANPNAQSICPGVPANVLEGLRDGTLTESIIQTNLYSHDATLDDVHADLISRHAEAQAALDATNPPLGGLVGTTWDGTTWE